MGADVVVDPTTQDLVEVVRHETDGVGVSLAVDAVTRSFTLKQAFESTHRGGTIVMLGQAPVEDQFPFTPIELKTRGLTFKARVVVATRSTGVCVGCSGSTSGR